MRQIREVLRLHLHLQGGRSFAECGRALGIAKSTAGKIVLLARTAGVDWGVAQQLTDAELEARLCRPTTTTLKPHPARRAGKIQLALRRIPSRRAARRRHHEPDPVGKDERPRSVRLPQGRLHPPADPARPQNRGIAPPSLDAGRRSTKRIGHATSGLDSPERAAKVSFAAFHSGQRMTAPGRTRARSAPGFRRRVPITVPATSQSGKSPEPNFARPAKFRGDTPICFPDASVLSANGLRRAAAPRPSRNPCKEFTMDIRSFPPPRANPGTRASSSVKRLPSSPRKSGRSVPGSRPTTTPGTWRSSTSEST